LSAAPQYTDLPGDVDQKPYLHDKGLAGALVNENLSPYYDQIETAPRSEIARVQQQRLMKQIRHVYAQFMFFLSRQRHHSYLGGLSPEAFERRMAKQA
jgi:hypothetical protein